MAGAVRRHRRAPLRTWIDELTVTCMSVRTAGSTANSPRAGCGSSRPAGWCCGSDQRRAQRKVRGICGRRRTLGLHGTVGVWAAAGFFFLSATGLAWSTYAGADIDELRTSLGQATPSVSASVAAGGEHAGHAGTGSGGTTASTTPRDLDRILAAARAESLGDPVEIVVPADASTA